MPKPIAVVLAGAVAKGAFEAGALEVLVKNDVQILRIVAASSGGLNGTILATSIRQGRQREAGPDLVKLWENDARWEEAFHFSFRSVLHLQGLSDQKKLLQLLGEHVKARSGTVDIELCFVVAALGGVKTTLAGRPATTFEALKTFSNKDFDTDDGLARVLQAAVASSAFPGAFSPVQLEPFGDCVDGGTVNNAPVGRALGGLGSKAEAVVVIAPTVELETAPAGTSWEGSALVGQLADIIVNERLYRDLKEAYETNDALKKLAQLSPDTRAEVLEALGWQDRKVMQILPIRPSAPLSGGSFSALFHADLRKRYVEAGRQAAEAALRNL